MTDHHLEPDAASLADFDARAQDGPIDMLNLVRFREKAHYHEDPRSDLTGAEAYQLYIRASGPIFARCGGTIIWSATPDCILIGPAEERWDLAFIARYPSATSFRAMLADADYRRAVVHRQAAVATSRLIRNRPRDTP